MPTTLDLEEEARLQILNLYENVARMKGYQNIAGIDEAGRGPLAGPVVTAACIIPEGLLIPGVNDSKQVTPKKREELYEIITNHPDIIYSVVEISHEEIDRINIYQATVKGMKEAIDALKIVPDYLLVDGMNLVHKDIPAERIVQGDAKSQSIAAASIIAKVTRDHIMNGYHKRWPKYGFHEHKGYGTKKHLEAIEKYGPCPIHRMTFNPLKKEGDV